MRLALVLAALISLPAAAAESLTVAVASNFRSTAERIVTEFSSQTGHDVRLSSASTGKLYAQLINGAPFDVFLAADAEHPALLEEAGLAVTGSRFTYAVGLLALWSGHKGTGNCREALQDLGDARLAIANPLIAPYGRAAKEFLVSAGHWETVLPQIVYGENVQQALHFAVSGNARYALIAGSQAADARLPQTACVWVIPADQYAPIDQQAILLARAKDNPVARRFLEFLQSDAARATIRASGYRIP